MSLPNEKHISQFANIHRGKRIFILASGSSLNKLDLSPLSRRITMGLNRSVLIYPETHYHCVMDQRLFELYGDLLKKTRILFTLAGRPWGVPIDLLGAEGFSNDLTQGIYSGYTVSYFALQLAIYMGFKEIFYLGLDLNHMEGKTHFFGNDFHSKNHEQTEFPKMIKMFNKASLELKNQDIQVYNCSMESSLEAFPKMPYEEAIQL